MSAPDRGLRHPQNASHNISASSAYSASTNRRRQEHVVDLKNASQLLEGSQAERQLQLQRLVRHYLTQILHGCTNPHCNTRTCLSTVSRNASRPVRPPTQLTARALAYYLATEEDPSHGLCPNTLKVPPSSVEIDGAAGTSKHEVEAAKGQEDKVFQNVVDAIGQRHQLRKDAKSLSQNLFDTVTVIYSYSKQLPSPTSVLDALRTSHAQSDHATIASKENFTDRTAPTNSQSGLRDDPVAVRSDNNGSTPHVQEPSQPVRSLSKNSRRAPSSPGALDNGEQVHVIPYHRNSSPTSPKTAKVSRQIRADGSNDAPRMSIAKTGKKNFTLGGTTAPATPATGTMSTASNETKVLAEGNPPPRPQLPVLTILDSSSLENLKEDVYKHRNYRIPDTLNFNIQHDPNRPFRPSKPFVNRSLFYTLSNPEALLKSFQENNPAFDASPLPHLDSISLSRAFRDWHQRNGALIFDSLYIALEAVLVLPAFIGVLHADPATNRKPSRLGEHSDSHTSHRFLRDKEAAHIMMICMHALTSFVDIGWPHTWAQLRNLRSWGVLLPDAQPNTDGYANPYLKIIDQLEYEPAVRLADRLLHAFGTRMCINHMVEAENKKDDQLQSHTDDDDYGPMDERFVTTVRDFIMGHLHILEQVTLEQKRKLAPVNDAKDPGWTVTATFVEWLKTIILKKWNNEAIINRWSSVGAAIMLLDALHEYSTTRYQMTLRRAMFELPLLNVRLDEVEEPLRFSCWEKKLNQLHVFEYPHLFPRRELVGYFRTINFNLMMKQYNHTTRTHQLQGSLDMFLRDPHRWLMGNQMKVTLSDYFFLEVSRSDTLKDTLDQLWGSEKRMLLKPLKVKMGKDEGEVGLDHGGVSYEFFRVVLGEAFRPDYGMFKIDPQTRMTWFQPKSLEADWKFEMLGIIFSLAVYNGITLPVTFPLVFYRFLLPKSAPLRDRELRSYRTTYIKDGWPDLARSLDQLLDWTDGDVGDTIMREYAFSYDAFGQRIDHNMEDEYVHNRRSDSVEQSSAVDGQATPRPLEPKLVTNANRKQFVVDYIKHLTYLSVKPQLIAFRKGFQTCINSQSLHLFGPVTLRNLVEGSQHISIEALRDITRYEAGYCAEHPTILKFWSIVETFDQDDVRHLVEFVTASDRVPVTGYDGITFYIVRYGGEGEVDKLPTSSTCFGKLYLPDYADKEKMKEKLILAIKNSKGFGVV